MNSSKLKNIVVLKDLPSNLIDEAFVILKNNRKIKTLERVEKNSTKGESKEKYDDYIVKEAEMVISNFLTNIEKEKHIKTYAVKQMESRYKKLKLLTIILSIIAIIELILKF